MKSFFLRRRKYLKEHTTLIFLFLLLPVLIIFLMRISRSNQYDTQAILIDCGVTDLERVALNSSLPVVAVVGDGLDELNNFQSPPLKRLYNPRYAQGFDMQQGVLHYLNTAMDSLLDANNDVFQIIYVDDIGDKECAIFTAKELVKIKNLVAVIGHGSTSTTLEAIKVYNSAQVCLISPIATSGKLNPKSPHMENLVQLPANNKSQASAIVKELENLGDTIYRFTVVVDTNYAVKSYSREIENELNRIINSRFTKPPFLTNVFYLPTKDGVSSILKHTKANFTDVIIYIGFGSELVNLLVDFENFESEDQPIFIVSDGALIPYVSRSQLDIRVAFPTLMPKEYARMKGYDQNELTSTLYSELNESESFEVLGYDAMCLVFQVLLKTNFNTSRSNFLSEARDIDLGENCCNISRVSSGLNEKRKFHIIKPRSLKTK